MKKALVLFECFILLIGTLLSVFATFSAVSFSSAYIPYFFFGVMGFAFIVSLLRQIDKTSAVFMGLGFIVIHLMLAGFGFAVCVTAHP
ncbi:MAG: hypothetical protein J5623_04510 [Clostridiales bacterium]|nr:hypothetical protein [Clostridiales bacterium]